jgi:hypothetical protein
MTNYTLALKIKDSNEEYRYTLSLTPHQENNPESVLNLEIRESMRNNLQKQSSCRINDSHLNKIVKTWIQDIKEGYRDSTITLDLPLLIVENISRLHEKGNQEIPAIINPDLSNIEPYLGMLPPLIFS